MNTTARESNFELLRILCMLIIILSHYCVHGGFDATSITNSFNKYFIQSSSLGEIGVDCFILISGYFLVSSSFRLKKLFQLELEILCYSIGIGLLAFLLFPDIASTESILSIFFPTLTGKYWFMSIYLLLYILSPFFNFFLKSADQKIIETCLLILFAVYIVIPTLTTYTIGGASSISTHITLYLLGGYIRLYPTSFSFFSNPTANLLLALGSYLFIVASVIFFNHIPLRSHLYFMMDNSLPIVLCSLGLFLAFKNMRSFHNKFINIIAGSTLGVYLIHDNPTIRQILWSRAIHNSAYGNSSFLVLHALLSVCIIFVICIVIDKVRIMLIEKPAMKAFDLLESQLQKK